MENRHYLVKAFLQGADSTPIHLSQNVLFELGLEGQLEVVAANQLGSETIVKAMPLNDPSGKAQTALLRKSLKQIESKVSGKHAKSLDGK